MSLAAGAFIIAGIAARFTFGTGTFAAGAATIGSVAIGAGSKVLVSSETSTGYPQVDSATAITPSTDEDTADGSFNVASSDAADVGKFSYLVVGY